MINQNSISIIIPVYNGWKHLSNCLNSLENQTVKPEQIIIVDDCSKDDSFEQISNYIGNSSLNIVAVKNAENSGPSISRKNGLEMVTSSFVCFCDCDDWYELDFIEDMKKHIDASSPDLIIFDNYKVTKRSKKKANETLYILHSDKNKVLALYNMSLCRFCISLSVAKDAYFPRLYNGEDGAVAPQIICKSNNIIVLEKAYYNYFLRETSASAKPTKDAYKNMVEAFSVIEDNIDAEKYKSEIEFLGIRMICLGAIITAFKTDNSKKDVVNIYDTFVQKYPKWFNNEYKCFLSFAYRHYLIFIKLRLFGICRTITKLYFFVNKC